MTEVEVSGVEIGQGVRLLVPEDGGQAYLFHRSAVGEAGQEWCAVKVAKSNITGKFADGSMSLKRPVGCNHAIGFVTDGRWAEIAVGVELPVADAAEATNA